MKQSTTGFKTIRIFRRMMNVLFEEDTCIVFVTFQQIFKICPELMDILRKLFDQNQIKIKNQIKKNKNRPIRK